MKTKKKENVIIIVILVVMVIAIIGVSYAAFSFSRQGNTPNKITTGSITMTYTESSNTISLSNALPTTDKTGTTRLKEGEYFDFTVSSEITGEVNINYEISAKEVGDGTIDGSNIKLYLTKLNGDDEEQLMTPEVYNEETDSNEYTGRPAGEMSLYTSSMNASESNDYRLRMYVTEEYNPQGDGGGLTFTVQVNVYGKAGDKYVPLTTKEILEDNEVQEEKTKMFNYTSNGTYIDNPDDWNELTNPEYVTKGLYSNQDEDGTTYYYRGNVDNNYVKFGEYKEDYYVYRYGSYDFVTLESCQYYNSSCSESNRVLKYSKGTPMYWRIVRVNGDGTLRLLYTGTSTSATGQDQMVGRGAYNFNYNDPKYTGYTYDRNTNETDSNAKKDIDIWYNMALAGTSYDKMISNGRFCSDSSGYKPQEEYGDFGWSDGTYLYASSDRLDQAENNYAKDNAPTFICPETNETYGGSYRLKAGLLSADEIVFSGSLPYMGTYSDSYLTSNWYYWSMSPAYFASGAAIVWDEDAGLGHSVDNDRNGLRPVINVTTDNGFTSGDGTASNPYVIS